MDELLSTFESLWQRRDEPDITDQLTDIVSTLLDEVLVSYENQRKIVPILADSFKSDILTANTVLLSLAYKQWGQLSQKRVVEQDRYKLVNWRDDIERVMRTAYMKLGKYPRIAIINENIRNSLSEHDKAVFLSYVNDACAERDNSLEWEDVWLQNAAVNLCIAHSIVDSEASSWLFYMVWSNVLRHLSHRGDYQQVRDMVEEMIVAGYEDGMKQNSFLCASKVYTEQHDTVYAFIFLNITLRILVTSQRVTKEIAFEVTWLLARIMREFKFYVVDIVSLLQAYVDSLSLDFWERNSFRHTLLTMMIFDDGSRRKLPGLICDYLDQNRENILQYGSKSAAPWLTLIVTVKKYVDRSLTSCLDMYESLFRGMVIGDKGVERLLQTIEGSNSRNLLIEKLVKLNSTRSLKDLSTDLYEASIVARNLLDESYVSNNFSDFLIAMSVKTDLTIALNEKDVESPLSPFILNKVSVENVESIYENIDDMRQLINVEPEDVIMWIGKGEKSSYCVSMYKSSFSKSDLPVWHRLRVNDVAEFISSLTFKITEKDSKGEIYTVTPEEHQDVSRGVFEQLISWGLKLSIDNEAERLLISKDMDFASIPTNLIIDEETNRFIGEEKAIANVFSTELNIKSCGSLTINQPSFSYWCPVDVSEEYGDYALNLLHSKVGDIVGRYHGKSYLTLYPQSPLDSDINMICAHGGKDISEYRRVYVNDRPLHDLGNVIGRGRLGLIFICHSGSARNASFSVSIHSLVKDLLKGGYRTIVAPMWSLPIDITPIWLEEFLQCLRNGEIVADAMYKANMKVKDVYPNVTAWGCLHLFGNPYLRFSYN